MILLFLSASWNLKNFWELPSVCGDIFCIVLCVYEFVVCFNVRGREEENKTNTSLNIFSFSLQAEIKQSPARFHHYNEM